MCQWFVRSPLMQIQNLRTRSGTKKHGFVASSSRRMYSLQARGLCSTLLTGTTAESHEHALSFHYLNYLPVSHLPQSCPHAACTPHPCPTWNRQPAWPSHHWEDPSAGEGTPQQQTQRMPRMGYSNSALNRRQCARTTAAIKTLEQPP